MKDKDYIKDLFSEKLSSHEVPVRSDLWSGIQSQIGNTAATTVAAKGISMAAKWAIGIASSVVVTASIALFVNQESTSEKPAVVKETAPSEILISDNSAPAEKVNAPALVNKSADDGTKAVSSEKQLRKASGIPAQKEVTEHIAERAPLIVLPAKEKPSNSAAPLNVVSESAGKPNVVEKSNNQPVENTPVSSQKQTVVGEISQWKKTNVFSPNGDGVNDKFFLETRNLKEFQITIYNNLTKKTVFSSKDVDFVWFGENAPDGNYGYVIIAVDENGNRIAVANDLIIAR